VSKDRSTVSVKILDKEYLFACKEGEQEGLMEAASYLDEKMRQIRATSKTLGPDRIAVMAAINIAHELLQSGNAKDGHNQLALNLAGKIDDLLQEIG